MSSIAKYSCKHCNISTDLIFCPNCGRILNFPRFIGGNKNQEDKLKSFVRSVVDKAATQKVNISNISDVEKLTDTFLDKLDNRIVYLRDTYANGAYSNSKDGQSVVELMQQFADICKASDCSIAIVGRMGAGKSTFVNALLGKEMVRDYSAVETSVLTKYRYSGTGNYIKLSFYKADEWSVLWKSVLEANKDSIRNDQNDYLSAYNRLATDDVRVELLNKQDEVFYASDDDGLRELITKYISKESPYHFFVKEAEIGLSSCAVPKNVEIVDTIGIDDPVLCRVGMSGRYVSEADIVLLCVKADDGRLSSYELKEYSNLFSAVKDKNHIYIVGTRYDIPKEFVNYWEEVTRPNFLRKFSDKSYCGSINKIEAQLLYASAWYYNVIQKAKSDESFGANECDGDYLAEVLCRCLGSSVAYKYGTGVDALKKCMQEHLEDLEYKTNVPNVLNYIMYGPVKRVERNSFNEFKKIYQAIGNKTRGVINNQNRIVTDMKLLITMKYHDMKIALRQKEDEQKSKSIQELIKSL